MQQSKRSKERKIITYVNSIALFIFLSLLYSVVTNGAVTKIDLWVSLHIFKLYHPFLNTVLIFFTNLNGVFGSLVFSILIMAWLYRKKHLNAFCFYLLAFSGMAVLFLLLKFLVARERPHSELIDVINFSFPSGHASMTMAMAVILYFIFVKNMHDSVVKKTLMILCIFWPIFIAFTRVYLNVHWFSDVAAGLALGLFWVTFVYLWLTRKGSSVSVSFEKNMALSL